MPHLSLTEYSSATTKPWFSRPTTSSQETEWVYSGTHIHAYLLAYLLAPDPHGMLGEGGERRGRKGGKGRERGGGLSLSTLHSFM